MSSTAFIEPLPIIDFVSQILNRELTRPLTDADRIKVRISNGSMLQSGLLLGGAAECFSEYHPPGIRVFAVFALRKVRTCSRSLHRRGLVVNRGKYCSSPR